MTNQQSWTSRVDERMAGMSPEGRRWVSVGILIFGVVIALWGVRSVYFALASKNWPTTEGTVVSQEYVTKQEDRGWRGTRSFYHVSYTYSVENVAYTSDNVRFGLQILSVFFSAVEEKHAAHYPTGRKVTVYYHPQRPGVSVLEPGHDFQSVLMSLFGFSLAVFGTRRLLS
jgi:hypothetical protein